MTLYRRLLLKVTHIEHFRKWQRLGFLLEIWLTFVFHNLISVIACGRRILPWMSELKCFFDVFNLVFDKDDNYGKTRITKY